MRVVLRCIQVAAAGPTGLHSKYTTVHAPPPICSLLPVWVGVIAIAGLFVFLPLFGCMMVCISVVFRVCVDQVCWPALLASDALRPRGVEGEWAQLRALMGVGGCLACTMIIWSIYTFVVRSPSCRGSCPSPSLCACACVYLSVSRHLSHISIGWCGESRKPGCGSWPTMEKPTLPPGGSSSSSCCAAAAARVQSWGAFRYKSR
eukprot:COSAG06_NODE_5237_length_3619_cov_2.313920_5_plen_204_part_00